MTDPRWPFTNYAIARWRFHWIIGRVHRCAITGHETVEPEYETGAEVNAKWLAHLLNNATKEQLDAAHKAALETCEARDAAE